MTDHFRTKCPKTCWIRRKFSKTSPKATALNPGKVAVCVPPKSILTVAESGDLTVNEMNKAVIPGITAQEKTLATDVGNG